MGYFIGIDVGGTFTDGVAMDEEGRLYYGKSPTTPDDFTRGIINTLSALANECETTLERLLLTTERFNLSTTTGTNLVVEQKGARTGLLATRGHGDALFIMRGSGRLAGLETELYYHPQATYKPAPLVPRHLVREIDERIDCQGRVIVPPNLAQVETAVRSLVEEEKVKAIAVAFLWSFRNPAHEQQVEALIRRIAPQVYVSCSHKVSPRLGEYERTVATVLNSYIGPLTQSYLTGISLRLRDAGLRRPLLTMQVSGGVLPASRAAELPITSLGSGPVGGLIGSTEFARKTGYKNVIATDMGGTSFEVGLIVKGEPLLTDEKIINQYRYRLLQLQVNSIACGGGTIARLDPYSRSIRVGPDSAGANPGPVCYGRGGTEPTVTDADVVLGLLSPDSFWSWRMKLDREAAREAIGNLGRQVGLSPEETAAGILRINNTKAAELIRQQTIARGFDPRDFVVFAYGGAGPLHAFDFARELGVAGVVIPLGNGASTLSAYGCATSNMVRFIEREQLFFYPFPLEELNRLLSSMEEEAVRSMAEMGQTSEEIALERFALLRYSGQWLHHLPVKLPGGLLGPEQIEQVVDSFKETYDSLYGRGAGQIAQGLELFAVRIRATAALHLPERKPDAEPVAAIDGRACRGSRTIFWPDQMAEVKSRIFDGRRLRFDNRIAGPAVVELPFTSIPVAIGQTLTVDAFGNLLLHFK